ncbi:MAG TPA: fumarylacetoacetate hydrolase family protein [Alloprevotella sp.]|nr:fumarylacetoacetate hydrolase family protein [Alloprevotella sp.]
MKIIGVTGNYPDSEYNISTANTFLNKGVSIYAVPDTALLRNGNPFFIPEYAPRCTMQVHLVARICRLGRYISPRFAHRYYDALTVGIAFTAQDLFEQLRAAGAPWDISKGFDGAAAVGTFKEIDEKDRRTARPYLRMEIDKNTELEVKTENMINSIENLISCVSKFYMLRQGDLIFTGSPGVSAVARIDTHVDAFLNEERLLSFNIK